MKLRDPTHLFEGEISDSARRKAEIVSSVTQPMVISVLLYAIVCLVCESPAEFAYVYGICLFFGCVLTIIEVGFYSKKFNNDDGDIVRREDRFVPLVFGVLSYLMGTAALWSVDAPTLVLALFVCYTLVTFAILVITTRWKISLHACGMIGPGMAVTIAFFPYGLICFLPVPFICWARYVLRKHTPAQMAGGIAVGFCISAAVFAVMLRYIFRRLIYL